MSIQNTEEGTPEITMEHPQYLAFQERARGTNVNEYTLLATDYLNHYNEVVMLLDMIPDMPELLEDAHAWTPLSYKGHFMQSTIADKDLAIEAYDYVPTVLRTAFEESVAQLDAMVLYSIENIERDIESEHQDLLRESVSAISVALQRGMDVVSGIINSRQDVVIPTGEATLVDQSDIDALFD